MIYRRLGRTALQVSALCLGTMNFGPRTSEAESFAILDDAVEAGINFIDTANQYGGHLGVGATETLLGGWLRGNPARRDQIVLATKVHEPMSDDINDRGLSARHIQMACDASLKRLRVDHIDLYQMHHIDRAASPEEVWQAMDRLIAQGKIPADSSAVLCITGNGLKTLDAVANHVGSTREIRPSLREFEALRAADQPELVTA